MKSHVQVIKLSITLIGCSIISIISLYYLTLESSIKQFLLSIFIGIFTSAFVSLIIYSTEYNNIKISTLENFYTASYDILSKYSNLKFLYFDEPMDLITDFYDEQSINKIYGQVNILKMKFDARNKLIEYYISTEQICDSALPISYIYNLLTGKINKYNKQIEEIVDQYITLDNIDYTPINNTYGQINFLIGNKYRNRVYDSIYTPLNEMSIAIKLFAYHARTYKDNKDSNISVIIAEIIELQDKIFRYEHSEEETSSISIVYNDFYDKMYNTIEEFRARLYKQTPNYRNSNSYIYLKNINKNRL